MKDLNARLNINRMLSTGKRHTFANYPSITIYEPPKPISVSLWACHKMLCYIAYKKS